MKKIQKRFSGPTIWHVFLIVLTIWLSSCATVQPWEREYLADPIMSMDPADADGFLQEVVEIREASALGGEGTGGGCGCN